MSKKRVHKGIVGAYIAIENGVVNSYKAIEHGVVSGYKAVESATVDQYRSIEDSARRLGCSLTEEYHRLKGKHDEDAR